MSKTITVTLRQPITGHSGTITEIVLRPPSMMEYARIGDPYSTAPGPEGKILVVENDAAFAQYVEACVVEPKDKLLLDQVELADAMKVKDAIFDFFFEARQASRSPTSPTP